MHFCVPEEQQLVHIAARPTDVLKTVSHHNPEQVIVSDTIPRKAFKPEQTKIFRSSGDLALLQSRRGKLSYTSFKFCFNISGPMPQTIYEIAFVLKKYQIIKSSERVFYDKSIFKQT